MFYKTTVKTILNEEKRNALISQAKQGGSYKDTSNGKNRFERRKKSKLASSVKHFNAIDMDKLFKSDILDVNIDVVGETNTYLVRISFNGFLDALHNYIRVKDERDSINRKLITQSLTQAFNSNDIYFSCNCPDYRYRMAYHNTKKNQEAGMPESRPIRKDVYHAGGLESANYYDDKGPACKHVVLTLRDASWLIRVASVIYNYINYMKEHRARDYQKYIYPAIYQEPYPDEIQLELIDMQEEPTKTEDDIDLSEYQEVVDQDMKSMGRLSTTTRALIDDAGLSLEKNREGSYTVKGVKIPTDTTAVTNANKAAQDRFDRMKFKKVNNNNNSDNQLRLDFDKLEDDLSEE